VDPVPDPLLFFSGSAEKKVLQLLLVVVAIPSYVGPLSSQHNAYSGYGSTRGGAPAREFGVCLATSHLKK
jgi:hypothetical protein